MGRGYGENKCYSINRKEKTIKTKYAQIKQHTVVRNSFMEEAGELK